MMEELCYSALDLAAIISGMGLGCRAKADFLEHVWEMERPFPQKMYRENKRQLILDVNYWLTYLSDKLAIDAEFPIIQKDALALGSELPADAYVGGLLQPRPFLQKCPTEDTLWRRQGLCENQTADADGTVWIQEIVPGAGRAF